MKTLKQIAAEIRQELKRQFPEHKFSVVKRNGIEIIVALMEAPESPFASLETTTGHTHNGTYAQLNSKHIGETSNGYYLTEQAVQMLKQVVEIANRDNWDNSVLVEDYHDVNYYLALEIGKWDKPFTART